MYHLIRILAFEAFVPRCFDFENIKSCILASGNIELRLERKKKRRERKWKKIELRYWESGRQALTRKNI